MIRRSQNRISIRHFSVRGLLIAVALFGVWLGLEVNRVRRQRVAIAAVERLGGRVWYSQDLGSFFPAPAVVSKPGWLTRLVGKEYADYVAQVDLSGTAAGDADLAALKPLTKLEQLFLNGTNVTDRGMQKVSRLPSLTLLDLSDTNVGDDGLERLRPIKGLDWLNLENTRVTDEGMSVLSEFPDLCWLSIENTQVGDAGIAPLRSLKKLKSFYVQGSRITPPPDQGLGQHLASYPLH